MRPLLIAALLILAACGSEPSPAQTYWDKVAECSSGEPAPLCTCNVTYACDPDCGCDVACCACLCDHDDHACEAGCDCDPECQGVCPCKGDPLCWC